MMILKPKLIVLALLLIMLFAINGAGELAPWVTIGSLGSSQNREADTNLNGADEIGTTSEVAHNNLLLGGIMQDKPCVEPCSSSANIEYKEIAAALGADYLPMYNDGLESDINEVRKAALGDATDQNGLKALLQLNPDEKQFDTIVAYSGGTSTAVTALANYAKYGITCDTLILVSPMAAAIGDGAEETAAIATGIGGTVAATGTGLAIASNPATLAASATPLGAVATTLVIPTATAAGGVLAGRAVLGVADTIANRAFEDQIKTILKNNPNLKLIVIQSPEKDKPTPFISGVYQYTFGKSKAFDEYKDRIVIDNAELTSTDEQAHEDLFFEYAASHLANAGNGIKFSPTGQSKNPNPFEANAQKANWRSDIVMIDDSYGENYFSETEKFEEIKRLNHIEGVQKAVALCQQGKCIEGVEMYEKITGFPSGNIHPPNVWFEIGDALFKQGNYAEAIEMYDNIFNVGSADYNNLVPSAWKRIGEALKNLGRVDEANAAFVKADNLMQESGNLKKPGQGGWLGDSYGYLGHEEEDKMIRSTGGYSQPGPSSVSSRSSGSVQQAIDNMEPVGEYNHYENTNPVFCQNTCIDGVCGCYDVENSRFV